MRVFRIFSHLARNALVQLEVEVLAAHADDSLLLLSLTSVLNAFCIVLCSTASLEPYERTDEAGERERERESSRVRESAARSFGYRQLPRAMRARFGQPEIVKRKRTALFNINVA